MQLCDDDLGGGDGDGNALAVGLVAGDLLDVDDELETVGGGNLTLTALLGSAGDGNVVADTNGDGADLFKADCVRVPSNISFFFPSSGFNFFHWVYVHFDSVGKRTFFS